MKRSLLTMLAVAGSALLATSVSAQIVAATTCAGAPFVTPANFVINGLGTAFEGGNTCLNFPANEMGAKWIAYRPVSSGPVSISMTPVGGGLSELSLFGSCGGASLACNRGLTGPAVLNFDAVAGTNYVIRFAAANDQRNRTFNIAFSGPAGSDPRSVTGFTYQGELKLNGAAVNTPVDLQVKLFAGGLDNTQIGSTETISGVPVSNGLFTVTLNQLGTFGLTAFDVPGRTLEIAVRPAGSNGAFTIISPRQILTGTPFSLNTGWSTANGTSFRNGPVAIGRSAVDAGAIFEIADRARIRTGGAGNTAGFWLNNSVGSDSAFIGNLTDRTVGLFGSSSGWTFQMDTITGNSAFGGSPHPTSRLAVNGNIRCNTVTILGGSDIAEPFDVAASDSIKPQPGMLVSIDPANVGKLVVSRGADDRRIAGIISGANGIAPGLSLTQEGTTADGKLPVAMTGRVYCFCDADASGAIEPGDLLTTADTPGHAMRVSDHSRAGGAIVGKAMSSLKSGKGLVLVLVNLQ